MTANVATLPRRSTLTDPEVELMLRVQRDEDGAYEQLVRRYWPRVFGRLFRQLGDRQEAEDLAQDVFFRVFRSRKRYQPQAKFTTWLFHIAQNVARNALRTRRRHPVQPFTTVTSHARVPENLLHDRIESESPSTSMERAELAGVVRHALSELVSRQRTALELQFEDHSYAEIAARLAMTPKAAKSLLYRARVQLRQTLAARFEPVD